MIYDKYKTNSIINEIITAILSLKLSSTIDVESIFIFERIKGKLGKFRKLTTLKRN
jgi:hypothetical protein